MTSADKKQLAMDKLVEFCFLRESLGHKKIKRDACQAVAESHVGQIVFTNEDFQEIATKVGAEYKVSPFGKSRAFIVF